MDRGGCKFAVLHSHHGRRSIFRTNAVATSEYACDAGFQVHVDLYISAIHREAEAFGERRLLLPHGLDDLIRCDDEFGTIGAARRTATARILVAEIHAHGAQSRDLAGFDD